MLPSQKLIHLVLTLEKAADLDLLEDPKLFRTAEEQIAARALSDMIRGYDYLASTQFEAASAGKSSAVVDAMRRRLSTPAARRDKLLELYEAVREIRNSDQILAMLPKASGAKVASLRSALNFLDGRHA